MANIWKFYLWKIVQTLGERDYELQGHRDMTSQKVETF